MYTYTYNTYYKHARSTSRAARSTGASSWVRSPLWMLPRMSARGGGLAF